MDNPALLRKQAALFSAWAPRKPGPAIVPAPSASRAAAAAADSTRSTKAVSKPPVVLSMLKEAAGKLSAQENPDGIPSAHQIVDL